VALPRAAWADWGCRERGCLHHPRWALQAPKRLLRLKTAERTGDTALVGGFGALEPSKWWDRRAQRSGVVGGRSLGSPSPRAWPQSFFGGAPVGLTAQLARAQRFSQGARRAHCAARLGAKVLAAARLGSPRSSRARKGSRGGAVCPAGGSAGATGDRGGARCEVRSEDFDHFAHFEGFADPGGDSVGDFFRNSAGDAADEDHGDAGVGRAQSR